MSGLTLSRLMHNRTLLLWCSFALVSGAAYATGISRVPLVNGAAPCVVPPDGRIYFLQFGEHKFAPKSVWAGSEEIPVEQGEPQLLAPFQQLRIVSWQFPQQYRGQTVRLRPSEKRDPFWDQILTVPDSYLSQLPMKRLQESGDFGSVLPAEERASSKTPKEIAAIQNSPTDPVIAPTVSSEIPWQKLAEAAMPLDFQKVLLASPHDSSPAFAYQNGQWLTTWESKDPSLGTKEDHWFAPALLDGDHLVRPAPLSAKTAFEHTDENRTLPLWTVQWNHQSTKVRQEMFSFRQSEATPSLSVFVRFRLEPASPETRLALGVGRRPNAHYWDDKSRERSPLPFLTLPADYQKRGHQLLDGWDRVVLESPQDFTLESCGPLEMLIIFTPDENGIVELSTPQTGEVGEEESSSRSDFLAMEQQFRQQWQPCLTVGAQADLPAPSWTDRIDIWLTQVEAITRVPYQGRDRLAYGAYFYQHYFGIEEGWPVIALAQWGHSREAQRQAEIMLEDENLDKTDVHHQSRNGAAPWAAAAVARLTHDREWLATVAPKMIECAEWTRSVRNERPELRSETTQGLLPAHIYGGDVRDPATSVYATAICWKGMMETVEVLERLGGKRYRETTAQLHREADDLRRRLFDVMRSVAVDTNGDLFIPLALELPSLGGRNEGPYQSLTQTRLGNYWNLFAPSLLQLQLCGPDPWAFPDREVIDYMRQHGGLWACLPRFYNGLDAAYAGGAIDYLLNASATDPRCRPQALAALEAYFLHAASRNGYTIPEVAGLFPYRLDRAAYEQLVRESPWSFGMYDAQRYLEGHISFTEPLGAGAGQALWLIRDALLLETRDGNGLPDGGLIILPTVPSDWFAQGKHIELREFPTPYGVLNARVESHVDTLGTIVFRYRWRKWAGDSLDYPPQPFRVRLAPPGKQTVDVNFVPQDTGELTWRVP